MVASNKPTPEDVLHLLEEHGSEGLTCAEIATRLGISITDTFGLVGPLIWDLTLDHDQKGSFREARCWIRKVPVSDEEPDETAAAEETVS